MQQHDENLYDILNIPKNATKKDIKNSYRKLALKYHPDKNSQCDPVIFQKINEAYTILSNDNKKKIYDISESCSVKFNDMDNIIHLFNKTLRDFDPALYTLSMMLFKKLSNPKFKKSFKDSFKNIFQKKEEEKSQEQFKNNNVEHHHKKKMKPIISFIKVSLNDIMNEKVKKVIISVYRYDEKENKLKKIKKKFFIGLHNIKKTYIYENMGDDPNNDDMIRGDVIFKLRIENSPPFRYEHELCDNSDMCVGHYDIHLHINISIFEMFHGIDTIFSHPDGKTKITIKKDSFYPCSYLSEKKENLGIPYYDFDPDKNEFIKKYGDLHLKYAPIYPESFNDIEMPSSFKETIKEYFSPMY
jgi:DnaJ-class molecular chaperone